MNYVLMMYLGFTTVAVDTFPNFEQCTVRQNKVNEYLKRTKKPHYVWCEVRYDT